MSERRYYGVEDMGLNQQQRTAIVNAIMQLGYNNEHPNPAWRNHWRIRIDDLAVIFEATWNIETWTIGNVKAYLADAVKIDPAIIDHRIEGTKYGDLVTLSVGGVDRLRIMVFGGFEGSYDESHGKVLEYLDDNQENWGGGEA